MASSLELDLRSPISHKVAGFFAMSYVSLVCLPINPMGIFCQPTLFSANSSLVFTWSSVHVNFSPQLTFLDLDSWHHSRRFVRRSVYDLTRGNLECSRRYARWDEDDGVSADEEHFWLFLYGLEGRVSNASVGRVYGKEWDEQLDQRSELETAYRLQIQPR